MTDDKPKIHAMARKLHLAADRIAERAPEDNATLLRAAADCIDVLWRIGEARAEFIEALRARELDATAAPVVDEARRLFELNSAGWSSVTPWEELSDDTREHWMDFARRRLSAAPVVVGEDMVERAVVAMDAVREWNPHIKGDYVRRLARAALAAALAGD